MAELKLKMDNGKDPKKERLNARKVIAFRIREYLEKNNHLIPDAMLKKIIKEETPFYNKLYATDRSRLRQAIKKEMKLLCKLKRSKDYAAFCVREKTENGLCVKKVREIHQENLENNAIQSSLDAARYQELKGKTYVEQEVLDEKWRREIELQVMKEV